MLPLQATFSYNKCQNCSTTKDKSLKVIAVKQKKQ